MLWEIPKHQSFYLCKKIQVSIHDLSTEPLLVLCRFPGSLRSIHSLAKQQHKDGLKQKWKAVSMGTGYGMAARGWWIHGGRTWTLAGKGWKWGHPSKMGSRGSCYLLPRAWIRRRTVCRQPEILNSSTKQHGCPCWTCTVYRKYTIFLVSEFKSFPGNLHHKCKNVHHMELIVTT